jgi:hypothetical protein
MTDDSDRQAGDKSKAVKRSKFGKPDFDVGLGVETGDGGWTTIASLQVSRDLSGCVVHLDDDPVKGITERYEVIEKKFSKEV